MLLGQMLLGPKIPCLTTAPYDLLLGLLLGLEKKSAHQVSYHRAPRAVCPQLARGAGVFLLDSGRWTDEFLMAGPFLRLVAILGRGTSLAGPHWEKFADGSSTIYTGTIGNRQRCLPLRPAENSMRGESFYCSCRLMLGVLLVSVAQSAGIAQVVGPQAGTRSAPRFAAGVLTTIAPDVDSEDTVSIHDIVEIRANANLRRDPHTDTKSRTLFEMANSVQFRRDVWCLELSFKPLRMLAIDIPQTSGKMQRKLIWYLVYRVRNTGAGLTPQQEEDGTFVTAEKAAEGIKFCPQFVLTSQDRDRDGKRIRKAYLDRILPAAVEAIQRRELPEGELLNSVQISESLLAVETGRSIDGLWGVATWEDVDPQIDFFSVFVSGLTNAYDWQDAPEGFQLGDPPGTGRKFTRKQLQLNFWRPGDAYAEDEREIRFGAAPGKADLYGTGEGVASHWIYR